MLHFELVYPKISQTGLLHVSQFMRVCVNKWPREVIFKSCSNLTYEVNTVLLLINTKLLDKKIFDLIH